MLSHLFGEIQQKDFLSKYWPHSPLFGDAGSVPQAQLSEWAAFLAPIQLLPRVSGEVQVWSSTGSRECAAVEALSLYDQGCSLYVSHVERFLPSLVEPIRALEVQLGVPKGSGHCSIFAGRKGAVVPAHCDHDFGFNLLLVGQKSWNISASGRRYFPLQGHQLGRDSKDTPWGRGVSPPDSMPTDAGTFEQSPGCCVFLPAGIWHQTELREDCISLDFAIDPPRYSDVIADALRTLMNESERFRAPFDNVGFTWWQVNGGALVSKLAHGIFEQRGDNQVGNEQFNTQLAPNR